MAYNFIHRILNAEIPPPSSAWDKIAAALDKSHQPDFVKKLSDASIDPPPSAWNNIAASLDGSRIERRGAVIPSWLKWSAAALVAGLVVISATYFFSGHASDSHMATGSNSNEKTAMPSNQNAEQSIGNPNKLAQNNVSSNEPDVTSGEKQKRPRSPQVSFPVRHAVIEAPEDQSISQAKETQPNISDNVSPGAAKYIPAPDYYVVTAPNGERTRISTKFSDAVVSLMGGDNVDYLWKSRFDNWKTKLISSPSFIPAAGNFLDIAELKDLIKEQ